MSYDEGRYPPCQTKFEQVTRATLHTGGRAPFRKVGLDYLIPSNDVHPSIHSLEEGSGTSTYLANKN